MSKKLTIEDMQQIALARGGWCLSPEYVNKYTKIWWQCGEGHVWDARPDNVKNSNSWCPRCSHIHRCIARRNTIEEMQNLALERGGWCLSNEYVNSRTKLWWQCGDCGNVWEATPASVKKKSWCPYCRKGKIGYNIKLTIEEMREIAKERGGKCLSKKYVDKETKLKWQCSEGHIWEAAPGSIKSKESWCPYCSGKVKLTIEEMREIAKERGGKCLSKTYINSGTKLKWQCSEGHIWDATPRSIKRGTWCIYCAGKTKHTIEEMQEIAKNRGGKCLSIEYINSKTKLLWQCHKKHEWWAAPSDVMHSHWCPYCDDSLAEKICRGYFEFIFKKKFRTKKPKWLINNRGNLMELDGYCKELKLAFEYNGGQHYNPHMLGEKLFQQRQKDDELKRDLCKTNSVTLIIIPYTVDYNNMQRHIVEQCKKNDITLPADIKHIKPDKLGVYNFDKINEMREIAKKRGGKCLSDVYLGKDYKLKWQCSEGHIWEATPGNVKNKNCWCPICARINTGIACRNNIKEMQQIALGRGGWCLSTEYVNNKTKLWWQCSEGHIWDAAPGNVKNGGNWCPECHKNNRKQGLKNYNRNYKKFPHKQASSRNR